MSMSPAFEENFESYFFQKKKLGGSQAGSLLKFRGGGGEVFQFRGRGVPKNFNFEVGSTYWYFDLGGEGGGVVRYIFYCER